MPDNVNHPAHYETNGIECIDAMVASQGCECVMDYCLCNAFKYIWRCQHKGNRVEDIQKSIWYLNKWLELAEKDVMEEDPYDPYGDLKDALAEGFSNAVGIPVQVSYNPHFNKATFVYEVDNRVMNSGLYLNNTDEKDFYKLGYNLGLSIMKKTN